jgi:hypothetical protein
LRRGGTQSSTYSLNIMTSKVFSSGTVIDSAWLNDTNTSVYTTVPGLSTSLGTLTTTVAGKAAAGANTDITSLASPALAGATATTQTAGNNTTKVATTAFVTTAVAGIGSFVDLTTNQTIAGIKTFSSQPVLPQAAVLGTAQATTSGTSFSYTSIPSWVRKVNLLFSGVSVSGTADLRMQLGTGGTPTTSGYSSRYGYLVNDTNAVTAADTSGFGISGGSAVITVMGSVEFLLLNAATNLWVCSYTLSSPGSSPVLMGAGNITLAGVLDNLRLTTSNGTDTFDAGSINIRYE